MILISKANILVSINKVIVKTISKQVVFDLPNQEFIEELRGSNNNCDLRLFNKRENEQVLIGVEISCDQLLDIIPAQFELHIRPSNGDILSFTNLNVFRDIYETAMRYYNSIAIEETPSTPPPPNEINYPSGKDLGEIDIIKHYMSIPPWLYPIHSNSVEDIPPNTFLVIYRIRDTYLALMSLSDKLISYIGKGSRVTLFSGKGSNSVPATWTLIVSIGDNPYVLVEKLVKSASKYLNYKHRLAKPKPLTLNKLGWCSWNALNIKDLTEENIVDIIKNIHERNIKISYVIIDDGWQLEEMHRLTINGLDIELRVISDIYPDPRKINDIKSLVSRLREISVEDVGLWHTINLHWGGISYNLARRLGISIKETPIGYIPTDKDNWEKLYMVFYGILREAGFSFVKVDNQWVSEIYSLGEKFSGESSKLLQDILQKSASVSGLEILNCMSTTPGNLFNYWSSNLTRTTIDYVPFWKLGAKLHNLFCVYNNLALSEFTYPDCDMFISYDPNAIIHLIFRILSGGPLYITDREIEKTNVSLLKRVVLPNGEIVRPDNPAKPTLDILFHNPYNEKKLLKAYTKVKDSIVIGIGNIHRRGEKIRDYVSLKYTDHKPISNKYLLHRVLTNETILLDNPLDEINIELDELEADILIFTPVIDETGIVGLINYILPPYPVSFENNEEVCVNAPGTLKFLKQNEIFTVDVSEDRCILL
ncbi:MAG: Sip1-related alpha-galactosidase [Desulfurococcaceae archaeon]